MNKLYILSAGTPTPTPERFGTALVLQLDDEFLMFDCGPAATYKLAKAGLRPTQISELFFSHHHFDHNADYPCFLLCRWDQCVGREPALRVWGPPPTAQMTRLLIGAEGAFAPDWQARVNAAASQAVFTNRGGQLPRSVPAIQVRDVGPGLVLETNQWKVRAASGQHVEPHLTLLSYRVDCNGHSIFFGSDTKPCPPPIELAQGADVMVLTCWDHQEVVDRDDVGLAMSGTRDVARIAEQAGVKKLVLTHFCPGFTQADSLDRARAEIAAIYPGEVIFSEELMVLNLFA